MIPRRIHFLFGLASDFGGIPFSFYHLMAVKSAKYINPTYEIVLHYHHGGGNQYWEEACSLVQTNHITTVPTHIGEREVYHVAHKADAVRMDILWNEGGVYMDMDTVCISPFDDLLDKHTVMGMEIADGKINGLCNAVMLTRPKSDFFRVWRDEYVNFDPHDWNSMSVRKPFSLSRRYPDFIYVLPPEAFFRTTWFPQDVEDTHINTLSFDRSYCLHLWETKTYESILKNIDEKDVMTRDSSYNLLARRILKGNWYRTKILGQSGIEEVSSESPLGSH